MAESIYKIIELSGTSKTDIEGAIQSAISKASETIRNLRWFEVIETRGVIEKDRVAYWQVTLKLGINIESEQTPGQKKISGEKEQAGSQEALKKEAPSKEGSKAQSPKYRCKVCGYIYDPEKGDPSQEIKPGTPFEELPDSWKCPECGVNKDQFEKV